MGNLAFTNPELEPGDKQSARRRSMHNAAPLPLELISKPWVFGEAVPDEPIWKGLWSNLRDALFPQKMPPLELTSEPVAVADPLAVKRDPVSSVISFIMHAAIFALMLWFAIQARRQIVVPQQVAITPVYIPPYIPPVTLPAPTPMGGGGGGGAHQLVEASKGHLPQVAKTQIAPPELLVDHPKLAIEPTVVMPQQVRIPDNNLPNIGVPASAHVALVSQGGGSGSGFGQGRGGGIGSGNGNGVGAGTGGGYGGGIMSVGGGVTAPRVIHSIEPEFTDAARRTRYQGMVSIGLIVDTQGNPEDIRVIHHLGMGLDEKAVEAVRQYRFKPAMYRGQPVPVQIVIDVDFHLD